MGAAEAAGEGGDGVEGEGVAGDVVGGEGFGEAGEAGVEDDFAGAQDEDVGGEEVEGVVEGDLDEVPVGEQGRGPAVNWSRATMARPSRTAARPSSRWRTRGCRGTAWTR
ncbi:hypothetical protein ACPA54_18275 [Uniformispora flossi]|uniref:hypothetical protein n=1 Tax=Uniformispora flossi TaxID=3390723 RepID=UPI003C2FB745